MEESFSREPKSSFQHEGGVLTCLETYLQPTFAAEKV